jgi:uncharacterized protein YneF (UPF0154 family)
LLIAGWAINRNMLARHPVIGVLLAVAIAIGHFLAFRQRHESMRRPPLATAFVEQPVPAS